MIPVHGPADPEGLADLYKHPGILDFSQPFGAFERRQWGALAATALPLVHSKPTFGYLLEGLPRRERYGAWPTSPIPSGCRRTAPRDCSRRRWTCWCWTARCRRRSGRRATTTTSRGHWVHRLAASPAGRVDSRRAYAGRLAAGPPRCVARRGGTGARRRVPAAVSDAVAPGKALRAKSVRLGSKRIRRPTTSANSSHAPEMPSRPQAHQARRVASGGRLSARIALAITTNRRMTADRDMVSLPEPSPSGSLFLVPAQWRRGSVAPLSLSGSFAGYSSPPRSISQSSP